MKKILIFLGSIIILFSATSCSGDQLQDWEKEDFTVWPVTQINQINAPIHADIFVLGQVIAIGEFISENNNDRYFILADGTGTIIIRALHNVDSHREWIASNIRVNDILFINGFAGFSTGGAQGNTQVLQINLTEDVLSESDWGDRAIRRISRSFANQIADEQNLTPLTYISDIRAPINVNLNEANLSDFNDNFNYYLGREFIFTNALFTSIGGNVPFNAHINFRSSNDATFAVINTRSSFETGVFTNFRAFLIGRQGQTLRFSIVSDISTHQIVQPEGITSINDITSNIQMHLGLPVTIAGKIAAFTNRSAHGHPDSEGRFFIVHDQNGQINVRFNTLEQFNYVYQNFNVGDFVKIEGSVSDNVQGWANDQNRLVGNAQGGGIFHILTNSSDVERIENEHYLYPSLSTIEIAEVIIDFEDEEVESKINRINENFINYQGRRFVFRNVTLPAENDAVDVRDLTSQEMGIPENYSWLAGWNGLVFYRRSRVSPEHPTPTVYLRMTIRSQAMDLRILENDPTLDFSVFLVGATNSVDFHNRRLIFSIMSL